MIFFGGVHGLCFLDLHVGMSLMRWVLMSGALIFVKLPTLKSVPTAPRYDAKSYRLYTHFLIPRIENPKVSVKLVMLVGWLLGYLVG